MERNRRKRPKKQNVSEDHREKGRMGGEGEKKKDVSTLDRRESHPSGTKAEVSKQSPKQVDFSMPVSQPSELQRRVLKRKSHI